MNKEEHQQYLKYLVLHFSLDGLQEQHEKQRGVKGSHDATWKTILEIRNKYPELKVLIKFTFNNTNHSDFPELYKRCKEHLLLLEPKLVETGNSFYYNRLKWDDSQFTLSKETLDHVKNILKEYLQQDAQSSTHILDHTIVQLLIDVLDGKDVINQCYTPQFSLFITSRGDIHSCLYYPPIGNIRQENWEQFLRSSANKKIIQEGLDGSCPKCLAYHGFLKDWNLHKIRQ